MADRARGGLYQPQGVIFDWGSKRAAGQRKAWLRVRSLVISGLGWAHCTSKWHAHGSTGRAGVGVYAQPSAGMLPIQLHSLDSGSMAF